MVLYFRTRFRDAQYSENTASETRELKPVSLKGKI